MHKKRCKMSKETTFAGLLAFAAILFPELYKSVDPDPLTVTNWNLIVAGFMTMVGLWRARDNNKSSETVGAK